MTRSLYSKFILGYLIFGLLGFITIATFSSRMTRDYLMRERSEALYDEANDIAASCSQMYDGKRPDLAAFSSQLKVWAPICAQKYGWRTIKGPFYGQPGRQPDTDCNPGFRPHCLRKPLLHHWELLWPFNEDVLTVSAPVIGNYTTYGYVILHLPVSQIAHSQSEILDILYITSAAIFDCPSLSFWSLPRPYIFPCEKSQ